VLVHGAFADAGGWNGVSERLVRKGYNVLAPANPLRGLASDVQYLKDFLDTVPGPIVLVGHSYGGFVMTNSAIFPWSRHGTGPGGVPTALRE
jgi:pimeloyl-ACP methyl ester carboxylesterase